jgi:hypothetical protein
MGVIAAFLGTVFSGISGIFAIFLARKATFSLAYIAVYLVILGTFIAVITGLLSSIVSAVPSNSLLLAGISLLPSNTGTCLGLIGTAHTAAFAYKFKDKLLSFKVNA